MITTSLIPFPRGASEGAACLRVRGSITSTEEADLLVSRLNRAGERYFILGTLVELDDVTTAAASALLVGINGSGPLMPPYILAKPGQPLPAAGSPHLLLDLSDFFASSPIDIARWADEVLAAGQVSPMVEELVVVTSVVPMSAQLARAFEAFRPELGATLYVPADIFDKALLAVACCGYPWSVRVEKEPPRGLEVKL